VSIYQICCPNQDSVLKISSLALNHSTSAENYKEEYLANLLHTNPARKE
jgi:hypothetical protein